MIVVIVTIALPLFFSGLMTWDAWRRVSRNEAQFPGGRWRKLAACFLSTGLIMPCLAAAQLYYLIVLREHIGQHLLSYCCTFVGLSIVVMVVVKIIPSLRQLNQDYSLATLSPRARANGLRTGGGA